MRRYVFVTLGIAALYAVVHFLIVMFVPGPIAAEYWLRELIIVKQKLAAAETPPRIIFLGGSSTLFSVDAELVSKELMIPAFNMGLHAGLRLDRLLEAGKTVIRRGDIVVMPLEYAYYSCKQQTWDEWQLRNMVAWDRTYFGRLSVGDRLVAVFSGGVPTLSLEVVSAKVGITVAPNAYSLRAEALLPDQAIWARYVSDRYRTQSFTYSASVVNAWGDVPKISHAQYVGPGVPVEVPNTVCPYVRKELAEFRAQMKEMNVRILIANAPYLIEGVPQTHWQMAEDNFLKDIAATGLTLIDRREELFMPREMFFNTDLHLNEAGRRLRTIRMIADLKRLGIVSESSVVRER